jgi:hypothetical protein
MLHERPHHELAFYFLVSLPPDAPLHQHTAPFVGDENGLVLIFQWFPIDQLETLELYPTFLKHGLRTLPPTIQHVVHQDP